MRLGTARDLAHAVELERGEHNVARAVLLDVEERIGDPDRHLVAKLGGAAGVAEDQNVCQGRQIVMGSLTPCRS